MLPVADVERQQQQQIKKIVVVVVGEQRSCCCCCCWCWCCCSRDCCFVAVVAECGVFVAVAAGDEGELDESDGDH